MAKKPAKLRRREAKAKRRRRKAEEEKRLPPSPRGCTEEVVPKKAAPKKVAAKKVATKEEEKQEEDAASGPAARMDIPVRISDPGPSGRSMLADDIPVRSSEVSA